MRNRVRTAAFRRQRLGEAETKKFVVRLTRHQRLKLFHPGRHLQTVSTKTVTAVALSGPPRRTASVMISRSAASGSAYLVSNADNSLSGTIRVTPSLQKI